jgi:hypothetical protein
MAAPGISYKFFIPLLLVLSLFSNCSMFKRTSKTTAKESYRTEKRDDFSMLNLKNAERQINVFTVWDSGMVYQQQTILENVKQADVISHKSTARQEAKTQNVAKKAQPLSFWIYAGIGLVILGMVWLYQKFYR